MKIAIASVLVALLLQALVAHGEPNAQYDFTGMDPELFNFDDFGIEPESEVIRHHRQEPADDRAAEVEPADDRAAEVEPADDRAAEVEPADDRAAEVELADDRAVEIEPAEDRAAEDEPADRAAEDEPADRAAEDEASDRGVPVDEGAPASGDRTVDYTSYPPEPALGPIGSSFQGSRGCPPCWSWLLGWYMPWWCPKCSPNWSWLCWLCRYNRWFWWCRYC